MSDIDSASLSSACSSLSADLRTGELVETPWSKASREPRCLQPRHSLSSSSASRESSQDTSWRESINSGAAETPSKESISAALDKYVSASRDGRDAFSAGNLLEAIKEFDQALDIELQTELECLYDNSIGMVSGLVRREVESRLLDKQERKQQAENGVQLCAAQRRCSRILQQLRVQYEEAAGGMKGKKSSSSPQWYLQMGAALVMINEWEKAKTVYTEGISICKDKKELKVALKNLIKTEQMTSYGEIPAEDQPIRKNPTPTSTPTPPPASPKRVPQPSPSSSPRMSKHKHSSSTPSPHMMRRDSSPRVMKRERSSSMGLSLKKLKANHKRERASSFSVDGGPSAPGNNEMAPGNNETAHTPPVTKRELKRLNFNVFNIRRLSSGYKESSSRHGSFLSPEEVEVWSSCFEPACCQVVSPTEFQPSAIKHMRRLSSAESAALHVGELGGSSRSNSVHVFTAINQTSLRIEDDDSDLDDQL